MKQLRSASYLIRENGLIVGMLCVNTDVGPFNQLAAAAQQLSGFYTPAQRPASDDGDSHALEVESLTDSTQDLIVSAISRITTPRGISPDKLSQSDRVEIIRDLNNNGMFLLRSRRHRCGSYGRIRAQRLSIPAKGQKRTLTQKLAALMRATRRAARETIATNRAPLRAIVIRSGAFACHVRPRQSHHGRQTQDVRVPRRVPYRAATTSISTRPPAGRAPT